MNKKEKIRKLKKSNFEKKQKTKRKKKEKKKKLAKKKEKESLWITFIIHSDLGMKCREQ
jgi:hypothetical protein